MALRLASGIAALAVVLPLFVWGGAAGTYLLTLLVLVWGQWEYAGIAFPRARGRYFPPLLLFGLLVLVAAQTEEFLWTALAVSVSMIASSWWVLFSKRPSPKGMHSDWARLMLGLVYLPLSLAFFPLLRLIDPGPGDWGMGWVFMTFCATWGGDTGAYFFGKSFGRRKLAPVISPKKTWEGVFGGILGSIGFCLVFRWMFFPYIRIGDCLVLPVLLNLAGVTGDLVESMMKRDVGIKDSGSFLPGHGGVLDRLDSSIFTLPLAYAYVQLIVP